MDSVYCRYCTKDVEERQQLVTATNYFRILPYHRRCFEKVEEETIALTRSFKPVNGLAGNVTAFVLLAVALLFAFTPLLSMIGNVIAVLCLYPVVLRVISYFLYERRVTNNN
ncbi:hypothetical protein ACFFGV_07100 [Pontibacillus salicampi]|uniref:Permease n=1 Tax=Pontibacillus salicampi TaxID=1449801 RepID=A0ABV6LM46_9BACI